jgi:yecA family protein
LLDAEIIDDYQAWVGTVLAPAAPLNAAQLQGLCAAMAMTPRAVSPTHWLPTALGYGLNGPALALEPDELEHGLELVQRIANDMAACLGPARYTNLRLFHDYRPDCSVQDFCVGFLRGVESLAPDWAELLTLRPNWLQLVRQLAAGAPWSHTEDALTVLLLRLTDFWHGEGRTGEAQFPPSLPAEEAWARIQPALSLFDLHFPFAAVACAQQHREAVAPHLLQVLQKAVADPARYSAEEPDELLHLFAAALLGEWRDPRAFEPLLAMAQWPLETVQQVWDESLDTIYVRALASTCAGREMEIAQCVQALGQGFEVRRALMQAWKICVIQGDAPLAPWQAFALRLAEQEALRLRGQLPRVRYESELIDFLVIDAADLGATEFIEPVRAWFSEGVMDPTFSTHAEFERGVREPLAERQQAADVQQDHYVYSAAGEMAWWASFMPYEQGALPELSQTPYVRPTPKVGRNEACPCGSGRKYKKCHGAN